MATSETSPRTDSTAVVAAAVRTDGPAPLARPAAAAALAPAFCADGGPRRIDGPISWRAVLRHKWLACGVFLTIGVPGAAAVLLLTRPQFEAVAAIELSPIRPRLVYATDGNGAIPYYQQYLNTQVGVVASPQVLERVLAEPAIRESEWYRKPASPIWGEVGPALDRLRQALRVAPREGTFVVEVQATTASPQDSALLANTVAEHYVAFSRAHETQAEAALRATLDEEYRLLGQTTEGVDRTITELRNRLGRGDPEAHVARLSMRLDELARDEELLRRKLTLASWRRERLQPATADDAAGRPAADAPPETPDLRHAADREWLDAYVKLETVRNRVQAEGARLGDAHPTMVELKRELQLAERLLQAREAALAQAAAGARSVTAGATPAGERAALEATIGELQVELAFVREAAAAHLAELAEANEIIVLLAKETDQLRFRREQFEAVRAQKTEREMESRAAGAVSVQARAVAPGAPGNTRRRGLQAAAVLAGGAFLGLGAAYVRAARRGALLDAAAVTEPARTAFLGHIPQVSDPERPTAAEAAALAEHVRLVRTAMLERLPAGRGQVVLVSSAGPRVGKTTVAFQLARSFAQCGLRVLLIDGDLRQSALTRRSGAAGRPGLVELLRRGAAEKDAIVETDQPGLQILPAGQQPGPCVEALADAAFDARLRAWRERYNVILVDSPPVMPVADAAILARVADGTVMLAREGYCRRPEVLEAIARLSTCGARLLGLVYIGSERARTAHAEANGYALPPGGAGRPAETVEGWET